jgi:hypothetical protein
MPNGHYDSAGSATPAGLKSRLTQRAQNAKWHRQDFEDHYRELALYVLPRRGMFDDQRRAQRGKKVNTRILNSRGTLALRTLQSGMQAGITSPARPWFRLTTKDPAMMRLGAVRTHTNEVERILRQYFQSTGSYNALHTSYGDLGLYGTDAALLEGHQKYGFMLRQQVPGTYWLAANGDNEIDTMYSECDMTVEQVVSRFVYNGNRNADPDWTKVTTTVKNLWDKGNRTTFIHVARVIEPRYDRDPAKLSADNKPVASIWWEIGSDQDRVLRNSGYDRNPIIASRWYAEGSEVYGRSPGMDALPDIKMLQTQERDKAEAIQRMNRPPVNAPTSMRNTPFSLLPGAVNFTDDPNGVMPSYQINPPVDQLRADIRETEERIQEALYANLFMMLANSDRRQITAREIDERHEEKLIGLGPVLELQHKEKLRPLILGAYETLKALGKLPEVPKELDGEELQIDYISMLAQAQKAVATGGIERLAGFAGNFAAVKPEILDNMNEDEAFQEYAEMLGTPARIVRDRDEVAGLRQRRAEGQAQQAQAEMAATVAPALNQGAQAAKVLAEASNPRGPAPRDVLNRIGLGP